MAKRKKVQLAAGQVVAIPLADGAFGAAHVVAAGLFPVFALYARRASTPASLVDEWQAAAEPPLAIASMPGWVADGTWPVVADQVRDYSAYPLPGVPPQISFTSHFASDFLNAYHGFVPWDGMHDPAYYEKRLLPGTPLPASRRFKKDFPTQ